MITSIPPLFPLKPSLNGRYLIDQASQPFLYHAETAWRMPQRLEKAAIIEYLVDRQEKGFNSLHLHSINKEKEGPVNIFGASPFDPMDDVTCPNEAYWCNVDQVLEIGTQYGFLLVISAAWFGFQGTGWYPHLNPVSARWYGQFLGERYASFNNIIWILGGDYNPYEKIDTIRSMAEALKKTAPHHLLTYHGQPENPGAVFFHHDDWLDINLAYTYHEAYHQIQKEYMRQDPVRPIILGETGYEGEYYADFSWPPSFVRHQSYWAMLSGAAGTTYGSSQVWWFGDGWRDHLNKSGVRCMPYVHLFFNQRKWWELIPDIEHTFVIDGYGDFRGVDHQPAGENQPVNSTIVQLPSPYVSAARTPDGRLGIAYLPCTRSIRVNLDCLHEKVHAAWYDPCCGEYLPIHEFRTDGRRQQSFTPPAHNSSGDSDWILIFEE
jgi:hypothetical protein